MATKTKEVYFSSSSAFYGKRTRFLLWLWQSLRIDHIYRYLICDSTNQIMIQTTIQIHRGVSYILSIKSTNLNNVTFVNELLPT